MSLHKPSLLLVALGTALPSLAFAAAPQVGEILFTELMINPSYSSNQEWFEIYSRATEARDLEGCILMDKGSTGSCTIDGVDYSANCFTLSGSSLGIQPGEYKLLAQNAEAYGEQCSQDVWTDYDSLTFNNSGTEELSLYCPADGGGHEKISAVEYDYDAAGLSKGQSWMLHQSYIENGDTSDPSAWTWCASPTYEAAIGCSYTEGEATFIEYGTPGQPNDCPVYPEPGEVIFSEVSLWPSGGSSPEWIELFVVAESANEPAYDLSQCKIGRFNCSDAGLSNEECLALDSPDFTKSTTLESVGGDYPLHQGDWVVVGEEDEHTCLAYTNDADETCVATPDVLFGAALDLPTTSTRMLELTCPSLSGGYQTLDRMLFNGSNIKADCTQESDRCSWELRPEAFDSAANDDPLNWGAAQSEAAKLADVDGIKQEVYSTPGDVNSVGSREYLSQVQAGDLVITELSIWPSTNTDSPDWMEVEFLNSSELDGFDLSTCELRSYTCTLSLDECLALELTDDEWAKTSDITPMGDALRPVAGDRLLFGNSTTKTCIETNENGVCITEPVATFTSVGFLSTDTRLFEMACPDEEGNLARVDRLVYDKEWVDASCGLDSNYCSWELRPWNSEADSPDVWNDDPTNWSAAISSYIEPEGTEARGTPGRENSLLESAHLAGAPGVGDVAFSELMIDPADGTPEWLELQGVHTGEDGASFDIAGCQIIQEKVDELDTCTPDAPGGCRVYELPGTIQFSVPEGEARLLVKTDACLSYGPGGESSGEACLTDYEADLKYSTLDFGVSELQSITLWCPDSSSTGGEETSWVEVDRFEYDWSTMGLSCPSQTGENPDAACSLAVHQDHVNASDNDDPYYLCITPQEYGYYNQAGGWDSGTPGAPNQCADLPRVPSAGDIVITEIMAAPIGTETTTGAKANEWFELYNAGSETYDFSTCSLVIAKVLEDGSMDPEGTTYVSQGANSASIEPGQYQTWAKDGCIFGYDGSCDESEENPNGNIQADVAFTKLSFSNTESRIFQLRCAGPGELVTDDATIIDSVNYDGAWIEEGHSWQLLADIPDATENDISSNWCQAPFTQTFLTTDKGCNYGTPGAKNDCTPPAPYDGPMPGCRCDVGAGSRPGVGQVAIALMALFQLLSLRSRRRK